MKGGPNRSEKTQVVTGEFFLGDVATGLKIYHKFNNPNVEIEIELKSGNNFIKQDLFAAGLKTCGTNFLVSTSFKGKF